MAQLTLYILDRESKSRGVVVQLPETAVKLLQVKPRVNRLPGAYHATFTLPQAYETPDDPALIQKLRQLCFMDPDTLCQLKDKTPLELSLSNLEKGYNGRKKWRENYRLLQEHSGLCPGTLAMCIFPASSGDNNKAAVVVAAAKKRQRPAAPAEVAAQHLEEAPSGNKGKAAAARKRQRTHQNQEEDYQHTDSSTMCMDASENATTNDDDERFLAGLVDACEQLRAKDEQLAKENLQLKQQLAVQEAGIAATTGMKQQLVDAQEQLSALGEDNVLLKQQRAAKEAEVAELEMRLAALNASLLERHQKTDELVLAWAEVQSAHRAEVSAKDKGNMLLKQKLFDAVVDADELRKQLHAKDQQLRKELSALSEDNTLAMKQRVEQLRLRLLVKVTDPAASDDDVVQTATDQFANVLGQLKAMAEDNAALKQNAARLQKQLDAKEERNTLAMKQQVEQLRNKLTSQLADDATADDDLARTCAELRMAEKQQLAKVLEQLKAMEEDNMVLKQDAVELQKQLDAKEERIIRATKLLSFGT